MSNQERHPVEFVAAGTVTATADPGEGVVRLEPRDVPLGGPRAMNVRRTLPQRGRPTIGAWCFIDHYGPDEVHQGRGMLVPPHPHTGLQTVSWLFEGEIEHRDSAGSHALVRPGELNLMTAGRGISHSEVGAPDTTMLHGVQLWVALPEAARHREPSFERVVAPTVTALGVNVRVFIGSLAGQSSPATVFSPLVGAQLELPAGTGIDLEVDPAFEHGVLVDTGRVRLEQETLERAELGFLAPGRGSIRIDNPEDHPARILLLGGEPFTEQIVMWWNFIGRSHHEVAAWRAQWQAEVVQGTNAAGRFGTVADFDGAPLPAPALPNVRLKPRG